MSPSLAVSPGGGFVVANDALGHREEPIPPRPLVAFTLDGRGLGKPPGAFMFAYPKAVVDAVGTLHVVWGEADLRPARQREWGRQHGRATTLWYATHLPSRGWTLPREIFRGRRIYWGSGLVNIALGEDGSTWRSLRATSSTAD